MGMSGAEAVKPVCEVLGKSLNFAEEMIKGGWRDGGRAYVVNTDRREHKFFYYNENDHLKWIAHAEIDVPAGGSSALYTPVGSGIHIVIDKLGIAGGKHRNISKGVLYEFNGTDFIAKTTYAQWQKSIGA